MSFIDVVLDLAVAGAGVHVLRAAVVCRGHSRAASAPVLRVVTPDGLITSLRGSAVIGSARSCDVVVRLPGVAARHAIVHRMGAYFAVVDAGSMTGTWVNGSAAVTPLPLAPGDQIEVGGGTLEVVQ